MGWFTLVWTIALTDYYPYWKGFLCKVGEHEILEQKIN